MGLGEAEVLRDPARAATFWTRFGRSGASTFASPPRARVVDRYLREPTPAREHDLVELDTFVVPLLVAALRTATTTAEQRLVVNQLARAAGRPKARFPTRRPPARPHATSRTSGEKLLVRESHLFRAARGRVARRRHDHRDALRPLARQDADGPLGLSVRDGKPILEKLITRSPITVGLAAMALALALALAVPVALVSATQRGRTIDHGLAIGLFVLYSAPTFWLAQLLSNFAPKTSGRLVLPVLALAAPVTALTARYQRAALLEVLSLEYVRAARARGAGGLRLLFLHVLPNAIAPTLSLAGVLLPQLFGAAFVVEEVFGLRGLGFESVRAVEASDHAWLVAVTMLSAVICSVGLIASDLAAGIIDPRVRELLRRRGRAA
ncbi:MAG: ABC transporter permease [Myxococcales bacterium]|nr:ABC transporter permease [Myxococcales bacterium]